MSKQMSQYYAAELLDKLSNRGLIDGDDTSIENFVLEHNQNKDFPLYLRVIVGVGAFFATLCFIGLIAVGLEFSKEEELIAFGIVFVASAIGLLKLSGDGNTVKSSFLMQSSFTFMATGKALFSFGMADALNSAWGASLALLIITITTYPFYRMSVDRFLSCFAVAFSILCNVLWEKGFAGSREILLNGFMLLQVVGLAVLMTKEKLRLGYVPLIYALLFSLCSGVLFFASHAQFGYWKNEVFISSTFISLLFSASLIAVISWIVGGFEKLKTAPLLLACLGAILLGVISAPGIILAIILLVLGYAKHEKIMVTMGALLVPIFLFLYYYNLDISLMEKSGVLVSSGIALILAYLYVRNKAWYKGDAL